MDKEDYSENRARYKAFMLLVICVAVILIGDTVCLFMQKIQIDGYEKIIQMLGIPTLLGMAFHAFFNENATKGGDNVQKIDANTVSVGGPGAAGGAGTAADSAGGSAVGNAK